MRKIIIILLIFFPIFVSAGCKKVKIYEKYQNCSLNCLFNQKPNCDNKCKRKYKSVLRYENKYRKCFPLGYEDKLQELRNYYHINIWEEMI